MRLLSVIALIASGVSFVLAFIARYLPGERIIFHFSYYLSGTGLLLLASIAFALQHLIKKKD
ncbi:MAG: hypothetical protein ACE5LC_10355 [Candidatus Aminicenantales bacterium]